MYIIKQFLFKKTFFIHKKFIIIYYFIILLFNIILNYYYFNLTNMKIILHFAYIYKLYNI